MKASCNKKTHASYHRRWWKWIKYQSSRETFEWRRLDNEDAYRKYLYFIRKDLTKDYNTENCERAQSYPVSQFDLWEKENLLDEE